jgi:bifunctional non-homologous end joining protein LigD
MHGKDLWKQIKGQKMEGMVAKEVNSKYIPGARHWSWLKIKNFNTTDAIVVGLKEDEKSKKSFISLILAMFDQKTDSLKFIGELPNEFTGKTIATITRRLKPLITNEPAFSEEEQKTLKEVLKFDSTTQKVTWLKPELIAEIKHYGSVSKNELNSPSFLRLRFDKDIKDCILEQ